MVNPIVGQQDVAAMESPPELSITICQDHWAEFKGTRAQLEAEGLIPPGTAWPCESGAVSSWEAVGVWYSLRRCRPDGHKGPMRSWACLDSWVVCIDARRGYRWHQEQAIGRLQQALRLEIERHSAERISELDRVRAAVVAARCDQGFHAFKAMVPGLIPPKRGRKPRAAQ